MTDINKQKMKKQITFLREPSKAELRHVATKLWGLWIDFESLREFEDTDRFYTDVVDVIKGNLSMDAFSSDYVCDTYDDLSFDVFYNTLRYLLNKGIIDNI